ncbi:Cof-type HAD-IIB family hydrolase [Lacticaseibacillus porcinae]|uniref:Cof-type HAD-IIB family hydrolase n=1 Tax=Lacticaseibacillus porcinae TaxID=1123687 RepID=UPI000F7A65C6|nr:Cof-type HAD-IIB family hydrolase [Lacticaseibacillus porcinae]
MAKAIVFFDLDGTLLQADKSVLPEVSDAIQKLRANGVEPAIATGRNVFEVQYVLDATGIDTIVSANGSYVQAHGRVVHQTLLDPQVVLKFNAYAAEHNDPVGWYNQSGFALSAENADTKANYQLLHLDAHVDADWYMTHPVNFMFVFERNQDHTLPQMFPALSMVRNNPRGLDVMQAGVTKMSGIRQLLSHRDFVDIPTYAFGDAQNDLPMFAGVDHPIAMGNGQAATKKQAEFVTTANDDHGIVNGLKHFNLL